MQANFVIGLGDKAHVPIISFSATSPSLSSLRSPYFVRATLNDSAQVPAIRAIVQAFEWREVVLIYVDNEYGNGVIPYLTDALQEIDTRISYRSVIHPLATDDQILEELYKLMTMPTRVFIVHMFTPLGPRLFTRANEIGMMKEGYVWILTDGLTDILSTLDPSVIDSMQGVLGVKPHVPRSKELESFKIRWKRKIQQEYPTNESFELNIFGLWVYDAASGLAMAVEKLGPTNFSFQKSNIHRNSTDLDTGLSGHFQIFNGQLRSSAFQVVNVIGKGERGVGFWTPENGTVRNLHSTSKANLGTIVWPGESPSVPKGWVLPTNKKKKRIGVPVTKGFGEFVNVTRDPSTNATEVTGFSIAVFDAVMAALPYAVPYEYSPFQTPDGDPAGDYNDLIYQVYLQKYEAVVGDTTILANRSLYVDFTLPYTESGVSMIVPIVDRRAKNAWVFLKPLTWDLWVTTSCFFVFIGFVIWVLEHRINKDFRGPRSHQVGTIFWFSFSTLVFAQKERIVNNLARFVVIIWLFVVLILTQSYTASLTSMLTVQQLNPTITDINELIKKGERVGCEHGSFVHEFLIESMKFDESKLVIYKSPEELDELFSKGGIAAAFDEIPYMKIFLAKYCSKYTAVGPTYKFDGFGFVFPKGSPLVADASREVLNVTEGAKMLQFEKAWFGQTPSCPELTNSVSSNSIGLNSFWGLFLIAGIASFVALITCITTFLYENRDALINLNSPSSIWRKIKAMVTRFDDKDLRSHTFRESDQLQDEQHQCHGCSYTNFPPSPSTLLIPTHNNSAFFGEQGTPSSGHADPVCPNRPMSPHIMFEYELANINHEQTRQPMVMSRNTTIPVKVGVVLDMDTWLAKMGLRCISMALSEFYASHGHYKTRLVLEIRDSKRDVVGAAAAALDLLQNEEVQAIIGPASSMQANFVIGLGDKAHVPIISFSATSPSLSSLRSRYFVRATLNDSAQVPAIRAIVQAFGWREVVLIYVDNEYGNGVIPYLTDALQEIDTRISYRSVIHPLATDDQILEELYKLMTMPTRVFIVHMFTPLGPRLFTRANEIGMMKEGYVWILTDGLTDILSTLDPSVIDSMQGVLGVKPHVPRSKELESFKIRWKRKIQQEYPTNESFELNIFGLWAYDAASGQAMAVEKHGPTNFSFQKSNTHRNSTDLDTVGVSQIGPSLLQSLLSTRFKGLSGHFQIFNSQLRSSAFQVVNVIGKGERGVGFWTPENGTVRKLHSTSKANLGTIVWPGESPSVPKGWVLPTNEKKMRIGVPVTNGSGKFVKVTRDPSTNATEVTGFSIAVFDAVMAALPYAVPYEYIPFQTPDYNDLIYQVYLKKYDAVVGDTTILANRSLYVDFTLPYTESGVSMIVPIIDRRRKNAWVFLKPLTWDLWVTTSCFFVFIGFVIWVLEHRVNKDFRGPRSHQVGTIFWFSFSTLVFAQKERIVSNLARFVVIIWLFVVLILTQSYTASLTSMLTVQQLNPTITDINELIKKGERVGCEHGSFVHEFLIESMKFDESNLVNYESTEVLDELFSKGRIAAAFDEIPYIKLFLAKYCSKYTAVGPTYKFDGFGFVFPKGSPLVADVSRQVLNVTEGAKMLQFEKAWFGQTPSCPELTNSVSSNSIGLNSFWGLFLIAGIASFVALITCITTFLYENRDALINLNSPSSIWRKIKAMVTRFDDKDLRSHTFRKSDQLQDKWHQSHGCSYTNFAPSPSTLLIPTHNNSAFFGEQGTPSSGHADPAGPNRPMSPYIMFEYELANINHE
uniref:Ionotropic glutamate receptor C-terminal domain-containing protein n=1 Tax=Vitis vinifera TaxID=29760 RepID=F6H9F0_VITVI